MPNGIKIAVAVVLSALVCAPQASAATAKERSQAKQIKTLKRQKATLKRQSARLKRQNVRLSMEVDRYFEAIPPLKAQVSALTGQIGALQGTLANLTAQNGALNAAVASLTQERDAVKAENAQLRGSVADGVAAIARTGNFNDFRTSVLSPAYSAWRCDSFYSSDGYTSYTFDSIC